MLTLVVASYPISARSADRARGRAPAWSLRPRGIFITEARDRHMDMRLVVALLIPAAGAITCDLSGEWSGHWPATYHGGSKPGAASSVVTITPRGVGGTASGDYTASVTHWKPPHQNLKLFDNGSVALGTPAVLQGSVRRLNSSEKTCTFIVCHTGPTLGAHFLTE